MHFSGSNTDLIVKLDRIPRLGETVIGGQFITAAGGKGANQAVAAARAGGAVTLIARLGRDSMGDQAIAGFVNDKINVDYVVRDGMSPSGVAMIFVAKDGENSIAMASGANANLAVQDVKKAKAAIRDADLLVAQLETPLETVLAAVHMARTFGVRVLLNPAPARPLPDELLRQVWALTPNENEAELLTGIPVRDEAAAARAAERLRERGVENVIITLGRRGALVYGNGIRRFVPAYEVEAVDTTAAGDVFNGALSVALAEAQPLLAAARFASAAAAISVTRLGAQPSAPKRGEIEHLLASQDALHDVVAHART